MNLHLREVICTSKARGCAQNARAPAAKTLARVLRAAHASPAAPHAQDGDRFWRMAMCYVRGNTIKYLRVPEVVRRERLMCTRARGSVHCRLARR